MSDTSTAIVLERPEHLTVREISIPCVPGPSVRVNLRACGICGSDARYYRGQNPWSLQTLGEELPSPPNMVLGHEVAGTVETEGTSRRVAILAFKACGQCEFCMSGRENLCQDMQHFGHSAGWDPMPFFPGGMSERFDIWRGFEYDIPESISFDDAVFLDGLAVAVHAVRQANVEPGRRVAVIGLGPIGLLAAQVASVRGAAVVMGCDTSSLPVELAEKVGLSSMIHGDARTLEQAATEKGLLFDSVIDTVGSDDTMDNGLRILNKAGTLTMMAVHDRRVHLSPIELSGERQLTTSANNQYQDFREAINLLSSGKVKVAPLVTHRFRLRDAQEAFNVMLHKEEYRAYKVVLRP